MGIKFIIIFKNLLLAEFFELSQVSLNSLAVVFIIF
jgi:hypothetical protein